MGRKRHKPEEIVAKLRQVDVLTTQGQTVAEAIRSIGVTEVTYYRWRQEYGGLKSDQVKRLKELEAENAPPFVHRGLEPELVLANIKLTKSIDLVYFSPFVIKTDRHYDPCFCHPD